LKLKEGLLYADGGRGKAEINESQGCENQGDRREERN